jgi:hypothetical protein
LTAPLPFQGGRGQGQQRVSENGGDLEPTILEALSWSFTIRTERSVSVNAPLISRKVPFRFVLLWAGDAL